MVAVSVIIPTYNRSAYVVSAIRSVLNQTLKDLEVIVVDDGSTDDTEEKIRLLNDERVRYVRHDKNRGLTTARNTGLSVAKGDFISWLDDDNTWLPGKLENEIKAFEKEPKNLGVVCSSFWKVDRNGNVVDTKILKEGIYDLLERFARLDYVGVNMNNCLLRRECFDKVKFDEKLIETEDLDFWINISKFYQFKFIEEPFTKCLRYHGERSGASRAIHLKELEDKWIKECEIFIEKHKDSLDKNFESRIAGFLFFMLGVKYYSGRHINETRKSFLKAIKKYPWKLKYWAAFFISLFGIRTMDYCNDLLRRSKILFNKMKNA
jgi:glycosyltransferase involved in cell wall biosynthesis